MDQNHIPFHIFALYTLLLLCIIFDPVNTCILKMAMNIINNDY